MLRTRLRSFLTLPLTAIVLALVPVTGPTHVAAAAGGVTATAAPDFTVDVQFTSLTIKRGSGTSYFTSINCLNGFDGSGVTQALVGNIPSTGIVTFDNPTGCGPLKSGAVSISVPKRTLVTGTFQMTIRVFGAGVEHDVPVTLTVR
jgi:hypothetical protein